MMLQSLLLALPVVGGPEVQWSAPTVYIEGKPFEVGVEIVAPEEGALVAGWLLSASAFTVNGKPLVKREDSGTVQLPPGFKITGSIDLGPYISAETGFRLGYANELIDEEPVQVQVLEAAPVGLDFMEVDAGSLGDYRVLLQTNRGDILLKFWPDKAPNHVRNFLDLSYTGFYDGTTFHRVIPGFMIQGGDPTGTGTGDGPRSLKAEFNSDVTHVAGVLSMARSSSPNSASCQFFIMHGDATHLDGQYSGFGELVVGSDVVDAIARTPKGAADKPKQQQVIRQAIVVLAREQAGEQGGQ
jgi:cyclophilin family peptidyl-prolyl cis-trans isomerase